MNKYQESLDRLSTLKNGFIDSYYSQFTSSYEPISEDIETLQELIISNIQAPKVNVNDNNKPTRFYCGSCNLRLKKTWKCCPRCATKIDWSNDE